MMMIAWGRVVLTGLAAMIVAGCASVPKPAEERVAITPEHRALAARAEGVLAAIGYTPGREQANRFREPYFKRMIDELKTEDTLPKARLNQAVRELTGNLQVAEKGFDWPMPPMARVPYAKTPIVVDGSLDDEAWKHAVTYEGVYRFNQTEKLESPKTTWFITWDDQNLYFAFDCEDTDIVSPRKERDDTVYFDDCVEMFILPDFRFRTYWELVIGPSGSVYDSIQCKDDRGWGSNQRPAENIDGLQIGIRVNGTLNDSSDVDKGYTVEVAVPFDQLPGYSRAKPQAGDTLHFMLVRLDRDQGKFHVYAYQPLLSWGHNIWNHAVMTLVKD